MKNNEKKLDALNNMSKRLSSSNASTIAERTKHRVRGANIYIQVNEPEKPQYGDLWFDLSFLEE